VIVRIPQAAPWKKKKGGGYPPELSMLEELSGLIKKCFENCWPCILKRYNHVYSSVELNFLKKFIPWLKNRP
jgi:hypothetical protein